MKKQLQLLQTYFVVTYALCVDITEGRSKSRLILPFPMKLFLSSSFIFYSNFIYYFFQFRPIYFLFLKGYQSGAPPSQCVDGFPFHGVAPQKSVAPYTITLSSDTYNPGEVIRGSNQTKICLAFFNKKSVYR